MSDPTCRCGHLLSEHDSVCEDVGCLHGWEFAFSGTNPDGCHCWGFEERS